MHKEDRQFWFRTDLFRVDPREDEETNPFCYGRELAMWIESEFRSAGYEPEEAFPEDWGWCVLLKRKPFYLSIACTNIRSHLYEQVTPEEKENYMPNGAEFTWTCAINAEVSVFSGFYWRALLGKATTTTAVQTAAKTLESILNKEQNIQLVEQP